MKKIHFNKSAVFCYAFAIVAKSTISRGKLTDLDKANSTPKACFFVRNTRTPKENTLNVFLSMVGRKGKGSPFAVFLSRRFSTPLRSTAHRGKSDGRFTPNLLDKAFTMFYLFKAVSRLDLRKTQKPFTTFPRYTVKIQAENLKEAQAKVARFFAVLAVVGVQYA